MKSLLAVDAGLKTGLALYGGDGRLRWYRSKNFGSATRLRRGVHTLLNSIPDLAVIVLEGGGTIADIWEKEAERREIHFRKIPAEEWRRKLLYPREQHSGPEAKHHAGNLARRIINWSGIPLSSLRHDTAEAIMTGLWAVIDEGWLEDVPGEVRR